MQRIGDQTAPLFDKFTSVNKQILYDALSLYYFNLTKDEARLETDFMLDAITTLDMITELRSYPDVKH